MQRDYAVVNNIITNINDYNNNLGRECFCLEYGHKVVPIRGKNKWYFRHTNSTDLKNHRCDIWKQEWVKHNISRLKLQTEYISKYDVDQIIQEKNNQSQSQINQHEYIWMIYIDNDVRVKKNNKGLYLEFIDNYWKYQSFLDCPFIFLNIKNKIYCVCPQLIKSHMIDVVEPISKYYFIRLLKKDIVLEYEHIPQSTLYIKQQGAGNGKTFGIIQMLQHPAFSHYKRFVFVSKQHSARAIIHAEFIGQYSAGLLRITNVVDKEMNKKYIIHYTNHLGENCSLIIATIDSFMYSIGNKDNKNTVDYFESIVKSIIDDSFINCDASGVIHFTDVKPKLNRETMLFIDETQDLSPFYADAILKLMNERYVDAYIVGDKLQSLVNERNAFTRFIECDFTNKLMDIPANICRRFSHPKLVEFVNHMVPFHKHGLIPITPFASIDDREKPLGFITQKPFSNESNENNEIIELIMKEYDREVSTYHYLPNNFLIVTPFVSVNPLVAELDMAINEYWKSKKNIEKQNEEIKDNEEENHTKYSVFHKSEEGTTISLDESNHATRIVSIHSSKGDGREVVFVVGLKESSLKVYAGCVNSLIYDSLLHVAITRMKKSLYVVYNPNDEIGNRINSFRKINDDNFILKPEFKISPDVNISQLMYFSKESFKELICNNDEINLTSLTTSQKDNSFFNIRYYCMFMKSCLSFLKYSVSEIEKEKQQIYVRINKACKSPLVFCDNWRKYNLLLNEITPKCINGVYEKDMNCIPIVKLSGSLDLQYFSIIYDTIETVQRKIIEGKYDLCPFELVILFYIEQIHNQGNKTEITMNELYNIVDTFSKSFSGFSKGHGRCLCRKHFKECSKKNVLSMFHHNLMMVDNVSRIIVDKFSGISWNINHKVMYQGNNKSFSLSTKCQFIGYNDSSVVLCYIKPWFNETEIKIKSLLDSFILSNVSDENEKNKMKYDGKKVICCFISLDKEEPEFIEWKHMDVVKEKMKKCLFDYYHFQNKNVFPFYSYCKKNGMNLMDSYNGFGDKNVEYISRVFKIMEKELDEERLNETLVEELKREVDGYLR
jgi:hypothetical protein